jgi:hypothetical protein
MGMDSTLPESSFPVLGMDSRLLSTKLEINHWDDPVKYNSNFITGQAEGMDCHVIKIPRLTEETGFPPPRE